MISGSMFGEGIRVVDDARVNHSVSARGIAPAAWAGAEHGQGIDGKLTT